MDCYLDQKKINKACEFRESVLLCFDAAIKHDMYALFIFLFIYLVVLVIFKNAFRCLDEKNNDLNITCILTGVWSMALL